MRQIGTVPNATHARRIQAVLLTQGIESRVDEPAEDSSDQWAVWAYDEDQVETARRVLQDFHSDPDAQRYIDAEQTAAKKREQRVAKRAAQARQQVDLRSRWERPLLAQLPITFLLIVLSVAATIAADFGETKQVTEKLMISTVRPVDAAHVLPEIRSGEVWRVVSPMFLHLDGLHLLFNMFWLYILGGMIEVNAGTVRVLVLVLVTAALSNLAQYVWSGPSFGGMSGVVYGLFGYIWMQSRFDPKSPYDLPPNLIFLMVLYLLICMTGFFGPVANAAHLGGLLAGAAIGSAVGRFLPSGSA